MFIACISFFIFSICFKIDIDICIDNYLRKHGHKSLAKKRKFRNQLTHNDVKKLVPKRYIIFNYMLYCLNILVFAMAIVGCFNYKDINNILQNIICFLIIVGCSISAFSRFYEVLFDKYTKLWNKFLLVATVIAVIIFIFFWD